MFLEKIPILDETYFIICSREIYLMLYKYIPISNTAPFHFYKKRAFMFVKCIFW